MADTTMKRMKVLRRLQGVGDEAEIAEIGAHLEGHDPAERRHHRLAPPWPEAGQERGEQRTRPNTRTAAPPSR
jgi:hypothetical protein